LICLLWWNPFVYLLKADLEQILEVNCDLQVTRHMTDNEKHHIYRKSIQCAQEKRPESGTPYALKLAGTNNDTDVYQRFHMVDKYNWKRSKRIKT
jgi:beta-lactamase regulating signal transducer with metallopeptidase domain